MKKKYLPKGYIPSLKDANWFIKTWKEVGKFSAPVDAMFKICKQYPNNNNLEEVLIKCAVIDNFSSTNVFDLYKMADSIVRKNINEKLKNGDPSLVDDIAKVEIGGKERNFYSFASKYCHYHDYEHFAIYDSYVAKVLCAFPNDFRKIKEEELREKYETFIEVLNDFNNCFKLELSYKNLDKYLWRLGRWYLNPYEPTPIYFHRQDDSPYPKDDICSYFWEAEKEFMTLQNIGEWKKKSKEWIKEENEIIKILSCKFAPEQFSLIEYIYEKYDKPSWIIEYGKGIRI